MFVMWTVFVSYIWGAYYFKEPIRNHALSFLALVIMTVGMIGVGSAASGNRLLSNPAKLQKSPPQSPQSKKGELIASRYIGRTGWRNNGCKNELALCLGW